MSLSEQNLVDCARGDDIDGCNGGEVISAFKYIHNNNGIDDESDYPYKGVQSVCRYSAAHNVTSLKAYGVIGEGKIAQLPSYKDISLKLLNNIWKILDNLGETINWRILFTDMTQDKFDCFIIQAPPGNLPEKYNSIRSVWS